MFQTNVIFAQVKIWCCWCDLRQCNISSSKKFFAQVKNI